MRKITHLVMILWAVFGLFPACGTEDAGATADAGMDAGLDVDGMNGGDPAELADWPAEKYLSCEQVNDYLTDQDPRLLALNVADATFYNLGHIPGSLKIPWNQMADRLDEVDSTRHVLIYCRRGVRSEAAYPILKDAGYPHLWIMTDGIERWNELGYPTEP